MKPRSYGGHPSFTTCWYWNKFYSRQNLSKILWSTKEFRNVLLFACFAEIFQIWQPPKNVNLIKKLQIRRYPVTADFLVSVDVAPTYQPTYPHRRRCLSSVFKLNLAVFIIILLFSRFIGSVGFL